MAFKKRYLGALLTCGISLTSCETPQPQETFDAKVPLASLKAKRELHPSLAHAFQLLKEEKYSEASQFINMSLQSQPKNVFLHLLNALTYEKLASRGDASGLELAAVGYQNAINLDSSNIFALTQLAKLKIHEKQFGEAQELFANALLVKPNDADLLHELAAASYYAYDIKTALSAIDKAAKLNSKDPLIHRSAAMIYAAVGDFTTSKKHLDIFQAKLGKDPAVAEVIARFNDWSSLYKSGRIKLTAATSSSTSPKLFGAAPPPSSGGTPLAVSPGSSPGGTTTTGGTTSSGETPSSGGTNPSGGTPPSSSGAASSTTATETVGSAASTALSEGSSPVSSGGGTGGSVGSGGDSTSNIDTIATTEEAETVLELPPTAETSANQGPQIIVDCYMLRVEETATTSKGNNILENLAVTLNPGGFTAFRGQFGGTSLPQGFSAGQQLNSVTQVADSGFRASQAVPANTGAPSALNPSVTTFNLFNRGSLTGSVFASGITWAGLTYSLNIANAVDQRTEVVSRPSLMTFLQKQSVFFSGDELVIGLSGQYGGTLTKYPVGVTLIVTPESLEGDLLTLTITIEGSLLTEPNPNLQQTVTVGKTRVDTYVKVRLGETLMLGGIYERQELLSKDGFPGLRDTPIVQYFFSNESTLNGRRSIVFMLTPRSPDLVKSAVNRAMARECRRPNLVELMNRNPDWFATSPNLVPVFNYISKDPVIYYEFRSGDVIPPSWGWEPLFNDKLDQLKSFLYY